MIELDVTEAGDAKIETANLIGGALDFWVCLCLGQKGDEITTPTSYSTDWTHGGPLLHTHHIAVSPVPPALDQWVGVWPRPAIASKLILPQSVQDGPAKVGCYGPTPLIAAMRAFVGGIAGPGVLVPERFHAQYQADIQTILDNMKAPVVQVSRLQ